MEILEVLEILGVLEVLEVLGILEVLEVLEVLGVPGGAVLEPAGKTPKRNGKKRQALWKNWQAQRKKRQAQWRNRQSATAVSSKRFGGFFRAQDKNKQKGMQEMIKAGENWWQCRACRAFEAGFYVGVVLGAFLTIGVYAIAKAVA